MSSKVLARRLTLLAACLALISCGGGGGGNAGPTIAAPSGLSYPSPTVLAAGSPAAGLNPTVTGSPTRYSISPALPPGLTIDATTGAITGTPSIGFPDSTFTVTASNGSGSTTFSLKLAVSVGPAGEVKLTGNDGLPVVQVSDLSPASGATVTVTVFLAGATAISLSTTGSGCGAISGGTLMGSTMTVTGAVSDAGLCVLEAEVTLPTGTATYSNQFQVVPTHVPATAGGLSFDGGTYLPSGDLSVLPASTTLAITAASAPQHFINGGNGSILISSSSPGQVAKAIVSFEGIPGYYTAPTTLSNGQLQLNLAVSQNFIANLSGAGARLHLQRRAKLPTPQTSGGVLNKNSTNAHAFAAATPTTQLNASIQLMGTDGTVSPARTLPLTFQAVGSGPIQVSLSWGLPVDVDLHVVTPGAEEIYYGSRSDSTGGSLDLDSNAGCSIDNVDQENIVWPGTATAKAGTYTARVDYWSNCGIPQSVPYTVRVSLCGISTVYTGTLNAAQADRGGSGSGVAVASFPYTPCAGLSVAGSATYEDYPQTTSGLAATARILPIRHATVEVHDSSNDSILATGLTDETGAYALTFAMPTPGPYYVKVVASSSTASGAAYDQSVVNNQGTTYAVKGPPIDASTTPNATGIALAATRSASFAGAFNIFDVGLNAFTFVQAQYGTRLPALKWQWTPGVITCITPGSLDPGASCYLDGTVYVLSSAADPDEYDDAVLLHEFGHFFMSKLSRVVFVKGNHGPSMQVAPLLAWSEGAATFFGQSVLHSPLYIDTSSTGQILLNLETPGPGVTLGTADGTLSGSVSEANIYALLWDLADPGQDAIALPTGKLTDVMLQRENVFSALGALKSASHDRGAAGADLVDFLDQWLCSAYSVWDPTPGNNFRGVVTLLDKFAFTPQVPATCN
ncbi:MAG: putative Ig domain-containing protein [Steroidobacteraceae bacterium]